MYLDSDNFPPGELPLLSHSTMTHWLAMPYNVMVMMTNVSETGDESIANIASNVGL